MNGNFFGARVTYNCNEGFIMSGIKERVCQGDSSWSDTSPQCKKQGEIIDVINHFFNIFISHSFMWSSDDTSSCSKYSSIKSNRILS